MYVVFKTKLALQLSYSQFILELTATAFESTVICWKPHEYRHFSLCVFHAMLSRCSHITVGISPTSISHKVEFTVIFTFLSVARLWKWRRRWFIKFKHLKYETR